ncbi:MAG: FHA domain-containing protein [Ktedonobacteraceae bacterium]
MTQQSPRLIGGGTYRLGPVITAGPLLTSYTAYNRNTNDVVGIIVLELPVTIDTQRVQALLQPLEQRRQVRSSHVLEIHDWGIEGSRIYIVTDPPRGVTLKYVMDHDTIPLERTLDLAQQMARGLQTLHSQGIAGLDLRPQLVTVQIVEDSDYVQLDDLGLRPLLKGLGYTVHSQHTGDIGYLDARYAPPEYMQNGPIGPWSDVYQVGLLLFELVAARLPFVGRDQEETGLLQMSATVPRLDQYTHGTPNALQEIIDRALAKAPAQRFPSGGALLAALEALPMSTNRPASSTTDMKPLAGDVTLDDKTARMLPLHRSGKIIEKEEGVYAYLFFEQGDETAQRFPIMEKNAVVGRADPKHGWAPDVDLTPADPKMTISRKHARIYCEDTLFYLEDLKSHNGSWVDEVRLTPMQRYPLQHGDSVRIGSARLRFKVPGMHDLPSSTPSEE